MKKYIIQVAPLVPLPILRTQVFSYWHSEALPAGTLVSIPFYFREIQGIVMGTRENSITNISIKLKNINAISEKTFLSENQVRLAQQIAEYYFSPLGSVLKLMVPKIAKTRARKTEKISPPAAQRREKSPGEVAGEILKSGKNKFLLVESGRVRDEINADLIRQCIKKNKQCLVLAPEIFFTQSVFEKLQKEFSEEIALIHSRITKGQFFELWKKIKEGRIRIVIASKLGIFLPFAKLGLIILLDDQDISFKQWESLPRYSAVRGAEFLADLSGAKLVLEGAVPSSESLYRTKDGDIRLIDPKIENEDSFKSEVVSLEGIKKNPDFPISGKLYSELARVVKEKKTGSHLRESTRIFHSDDLRELQKTSEVSEV